MRLKTPVFNMKIQKVMHLKPCKENHFAKIDKSIPKDAGIYFLFDSDMELLYIGKSQNIRSRILNHSSESNTNRLILEDKGSMWEKLYNTCLPQGSVKYYSYILEEDEEKRQLIECFMLLAFKPRFNNCDKIEALEKYSHEIKIKKEAKK